MDRPSIVVPARVGQASGNSHMNLKSVVGGGLRQIRPMRREGFRRILNEQDSNGPGA
jgi:hypothetical protein